MPILIDEVVIQVEVGNAANGGTATSPAPTDDKQALVAECVERVLDILRLQKEA
jgi:Family of unknown function (DUF5908)